jgi:hypothetical protein
MDMQLLKTELEDPKYAAMDDAAAASILNAKNIEKDVDYLEPSEAFEAIIISDYNGLSNEKKQLLQTLLSMGPIKVKGPNTRTAFQNIFNGTTTLTNLVMLQTEMVSWASQNWTGRVKEGHVNTARAM